MTQLDDESRSVRRSWREFALNVGAAAGALCIVVTFVSAVFGITPLVVRSGSMSPAIPTGSLALAREVPAGQLHSGDIASVDDQAGTRITHRVVTVSGSGDQVMLTLKGDANNAADPVPYVVRSADRVLVSIPAIGYVVAWLSGKTAIFLGGIVAGALLMLAFGPARRRADTPDSDTSDTDIPDSDVESANTQAAADVPALHQENTHV